MLEVNILETQIIEIANRINGLREMLEITPEKMAEVLDLSPQDYLEYESGNRDFSFSFLYKCADILGIDILELLTGENPRLSCYAVTRKGHGVDISRRKSFIYQYLGHRFKKKYADIFLVTAPYYEEEQHGPIMLSTHEYQEFDYVIKGKLKICVDNKTEVLDEGDCIYYDSKKPHGMIAVGGEECLFLAVVLHKPYHDKGVHYNA